MHSPGWRQLPWPVDDNYLGRFDAIAGRVQEAGYGEPIELAREACSFEAAAELLWTGVLQHDPLRWRLDELPAGFAARLDAVARGGEQPPVLRLFALADG